jgi:NADPH:quinone reductase-like Zn-dependent oxidoreductase
MQAIVHETYGGPEVLELRAVDTPTPGDDRVLVRVHAASVNAYDWHMLTGLPYIGRLGEGLRKPKNTIPGVDVAGTVQAVGRNVTQFRPGDEVFGAANGSFAEYACARQENIVAKPNGLSFLHAATIPMAGTTALQALRNKGRVQAGQHVLINGAAGGVGTFAVQVAKALGAEVTGVCSTGNVDRVRSLGADHVIDYTVDDFASDARCYDVMIDNAGSRSLRDCRRALTRNGIYVIVGGQKKGRVLGPASGMLKAVVTFPFVSQKAAPMIAKYNQDDLQFLGQLVTDGKVTPVIEQSYQLSEVPEAIRRVGTGHAKGKLVVTI